MTKQHILEEIKRLALENGGKTPGRQAFYNQTGLKDADWLGKYWSRWSEAVSEAGFAPNQMTTGYEEEFLLEKLIELTREINRIPVTSELRLKAYTDKTFPSNSTFENRFGTKDQLVSKIIKYCHQRTGYEDVLRICESAPLRIKTGNAPADESKSAEIVGFVYLIKSGKFYKIGKTNSIGRREYDLAIQLAEKPTTVHVIKTDDPDGIEAYWHRRFAVKRKNGEWFDLNAADVKAFKKWLRIV